MKMTKNKEAHFEAGPNMTPLVDIVMVILIFLMLAGNFGADEHFLKNDVPLKAPANPNPAGSSDQVIEEPLEIIVRTPITQSIEISAIIDQTEYNSRDALYQGLLQKRQQMQALPDFDLEKVTVVIIPDSSLPWAHALYAQEAAMRAQFVKVGFQASGR